MRTHIVKGARIISDDFSVYVKNDSLPKTSQLQRHAPDMRWKHRWVNHSEYFVDPLFPDIHTNTIERFWRSLKDQTPRNTSLTQMSVNINYIMFLQNYTMSEREDLLLSLLAACDRSLTQYA